MPPTTLSTDERSALLDREIQKYVRSGYRVLSRSDTTAQLVKPKKFSLLIAIIALLLAVLPFVLYLLWYMASKDKTIYLSIDATGRITKS